MLKVDREHSLSKKGQLVGRGFTGTTIKDISTKSRGRVEGGREVGLAGMGWRDGKKMQTTVTE